MKPTLDYKILKPKMTVLLCCYVWGFPRPRDIIKWSVK